MLRMLHFRKILPESIGLVFPVSSNRLSSGNSSLILFFKIDKEVNWLKTNTLPEGIKSCSFSINKSVLIPSAGKCSLPEQ